MRLLQLNYLHHALGSALGQLRNEHSKHFAKRLGIGESMYRMIESGNAQFPLVSIYPLIQLFPEIQFEKIAKFLTAARSMNNYNEHECVMTSQFLIEMDPELNPIFTHWDTSGRDSQLRDESIRKELGEKTLKYLTKAFESKIQKLEGIVTENPEIIDLLKTLHEGLVALKTTE